MLNEQRLYLVDASIYIFRYYFSMAGSSVSEQWQSESGYSTAAVYGYSQWIKKLLSQENPHHIGVCFDESLGTCFRHSIYPHYKTSRVLPDEALAFQLLSCKHMTQALGVATFASEKYEADDLIGTLARAWREQGKPVTIISRDKDLAQLIGEGDDYLWDFPHGDALDYQSLTESWSIFPEQVPDYLALVGDKVDDIPGVPGLGPKTAMALLHHYSSWTGLRDQLDSVSKLNIRGSKKLAVKLQEHRDQIDLALRLTRIACDAPRVSSLTCRRQKICIDGLMDLCDYLGFGTRLKQSLCELA